MAAARYVYWQDGSQWLGYFEEFPDYVTQGESLEDLQEHLKDLFHDLTCGEVPGQPRCNVTPRRGGQNTARELLKFLIRVHSRSFAA